MKTQIFGFVQGLAGAISGLIPKGRDAKKTPIRKKVNSMRPSAGGSRSNRKQIRSHRARPRTKVARYSRRKLEPPVMVTGNSSVVRVVRKVAIYACPACGLQAQAGLMAEHFLGSPLHQNGHAPPEHTTIPRAEEETESHDVNSRDSLRNLLQILVPPRAFAHRHEKGSANDFSHIAQMLNSETRPKSSYVG